MATAAGFSDPVLHFSVTRYFDTRRLRSLSRARISASWQHAYCVSRGSVHCTGYAQAAVPTLIQARARSLATRRRRPEASRCKRALEQQEQAPPQAARATAGRAHWAASLGSEAPRRPRAARESPLLAKATGRRRPSTANPSTPSHATVTPKTAILRPFPVSESAVRHPTSRPVGRARIAAPRTLIAQLRPPAPRRKPAVSRSRPRVIACWFAGTKFVPSAAPTG